MNPCPKCERNVPNKAYYCPNCGQNIIKESKVPAVAERADKPDLVNKIYCNNCGKKNDSEYLHCTACGSNIIDNQQKDGVNAEKITKTDAYFIVSPTKLAIMSIATFGLYDIYWMYKQWNIIKNKNNEKIMPFWRAFFGILFIYPLLKRLDTPNPIYIAVSYVILCLLYKLPDPWWYISFLSFLPLCAVQSRLNVQSDNYGKGNKYSVFAVITIILGSILFCLSLIGTFMPA